MIGKEREALEKIVALAGGSPPYSQMALDMWMIAKAALAAREEPQAEAMKRIKASEVRVGDIVVLAGEDEQVKSIRHADYGLIFIEDGNGREHEMATGAMVLRAALVAREDTERPDETALQRAASDAVISEEYRCAICGHLTRQKAVDEYLCPTHLLEFRRYIEDAVRDTEQGPER